MQVEREKDQPRQCVQSVCHDIGRLLIVGRRQTAHGEPHLLSDVGPGNPNGHQTHAEHPGQRQSVHQFLCRQPAQQHPADIRLRMSRGGHEPHGVLLCQAGRDRDRQANPDGGRYRASGRHGQKRHKGGHPNQAQQRPDNKRGNHCTT